MEGVQPRLHAVQALLPVFQQKTSLSSSLPRAQRGLKTEDAALTQALAFGVCRFQPRLAFWLSRLLEHPLKARDQDIAILLLIGLYQLQEGRIADYAAIDLCVETGKALHKPWAARVINACLRRFQREQAALQALAASKETAATAHPAWLLKKLKKAWPGSWRALCTANNQQAPMTLRVNARKLDRDAYLQQLESAGISASPTPFSPWGVTLAHPTHPASLPGFNEGWFSVQDEAAQLAVTLLDLQPGQRVLDACCAPGGKTAHLAETADLDLLALDVDEQRLPRVHQNLARLQLQAEVKCADAAAVDNWWDGRPFERILLDAPCSATGVIRRHPDIKLLRRETDIAALAAVQRQLLQRLWPLLQPGGLLLYATCSVLPEENQHPLADFLHATADASLQPIQASWGLEQRAGRQLLPQPDGTDGFFYCLLGKARR